MTDYKKEFEEMIEIFREEFGSFTGSDYLACLSVAQSELLAGRTTHKIFTDTKNLLFDAIDMPSDLIN